MFILSIDCVYYYCYYYNYCLFINTVFKGVKEIRKK